VIVASDDRVSIIADLDFPMRAVGAIALIFWSGLLFSEPALAEKRVALIIGNSAYQNVSRLVNPTNDAEAMAATLKNAGFDPVYLKRDLKVSEMRRALRDFSDVVRDADVAIVYYAGHGIEIDGTNYVIPTDAVLERDIDAYDEAVPLDRILTVIEPARQLRLIILDACRDNPFSSNMKRTIGSRGIGRGLAKVEPTNPNTLIAFASKAGSTASDGERNSPFTAALVKHITTPGLDLRKAFGYVRDDVLKNTGNKQEPYVYGSLGGDDVPLVPGKPTAPGLGPQANPDSEIRRDYEFALQLGTREIWNAFLTRYPSGFYTELAKGQLSRIAAEEARTVAVEKARAAEDEKARIANERAQRAELEKAFTAAKKAEQSRSEAERATQVEQAKAEAAEQQRKAAEAAAQTPTAEAEPHHTDPDTQKFAALPQAVAPKPVLSSEDLARSVQQELRRVGCLNSGADGNWDSASQRSVTLFNNYAGTKFDVKLVSPDVLDALKAKQGRVCPQICEHGFKADGDQCVKIMCRAGYRVDDDNECTKIPEKKPIASRNEDDGKRDAERKKTEASRPAPLASGQILCNSGGCRPVGKGCHLEARNAQNPNGNFSKEVCN
jgi:caspase domain-containing protein